MKETSEIEISSVARLPPLRPSRTHGTKRFTPQSFELLPYTYECLLHAMQKASYQLMKETRQKNPHGVGAKLAPIELSEQSLQRKDCEGSWQAQVAEPRTPALHGPLELVPLRAASRGQPGTRGPGEAVRFGRDLAARRRALSQAMALKSEVSGKTRFFFLLGAFRSRPEVKISCSSAPRSSWTRCAGPSSASCRIPTTRQGCWIFGIARLSDRSLYWRPPNTSTPPTGSR